MHICVIHMVLLLYDAPYVGMRLRHEARYNQSWKVPIPSLCSVSLQSLADYYLSAFAASLAVRTATA